MNSPIPPVMSSVCDACPATKEYFIDGLQRFAYNLAKGSALLVVAIAITGITVNGFISLENELYASGIFGDDFTPGQDCSSITIGAFLTTTLFFNCVVNHKMNMPYPNLSGFVFTALSVGFLYI